MREEVIKIMGLLYDKTDHDQENLLDSESAVAVEALDDEVWSDGESLGSDELLEPDFDE